MRKICSLMEIDAKIGVCEVKLIRKVQKIGRASCRERV